MRCAHRDCNNEAEEGSNYCEEHQWNTSDVPRYEDKTSTQTNFWGDPIQDATGDGVSGDGDAGDVEDSGESDGDGGDGGADGGE